MTTFKATISALVFGAATLFSMGAFADDQPSVGTADNSAAATSNANDTALYDCQLSSGQKSDTQMTKKDCEAKGGKSMDSSMNNTNTMNNGAATQPNAAPATPAAPTE